MLILLHMCPHAATCVLMLLLHMCPDAATYAAVSLSLARARALSLSHTHATVACMLALWLVAAYTRE
jgi:hypothetical protein